MAGGGRCVDATDAGWFDAGEAHRSNRRVCMMQWLRAGSVVCALVAIVAAGACSNGSGPLNLTLNDVSDPDSNRAVVVVDHDVIEGSDTVKAGVEEVYLVEPGRAWETLAADAGIRQVTFQVSDPYSAAAYLADDGANTFQWVGPTGTVYVPVSKCVVHVRSAFVVDTLSTLWLETDCQVVPVTPGGSSVVTILVKARRDGTPQTGP